MSNVLKRLLPRAPRYILRPQDEQFLRFAKQGNDGKSYTTVFLNISVTGLAFLIDRDCAPKYGEMIKIEFPIPGKGRIAWFGKVVRIEEFRKPWGWKQSAAYSEGTDDIVIGIKFKDLPDGHKKAIAKSLDTKFSEIVQQRQRQKIQAGVEYILSHIWALLFFACLLAGTCAILFTLSRSPKPPVIKKTESTTPWAKRFDYFKSKSSEDK